MKSLFITGCVEESNGVVTAYHWHNHWPGKDHQIIPVYSIIPGLSDHTQFIISDHNRFIRSPQLIRSYPVYRIIPSL